MTRYLYFCTIDLSKLKTELELICTFIGKYLCFVFSRNRAMTESPRRPLMNEWSKTGYRSYTSPSDRLSKRLGASLPNLEQPASDTMTAIVSPRTASLQKMSPDVGQCWGSDLEVGLQSIFFNFIYHVPGLRFPQTPRKVFRLPDFPPPLAYHYIQNYYSEMVALLEKAINSTPARESALLARYYTGKKQEITFL